MEMSDVQEISIVAGPGPIAYDFEPVNGILMVWVGEYADKAPETPTLHRTEISPPYTTWGIEQKQE